MNGYVILIKVCCSAIEDTKRQLADRLKVLRTFLGRLHPGRAGILGCELSIVPSLMGCAGSEH